MCNSDGTLRQWTFWKMYKVCLKKEMRDLRKSKQAFWLLAILVLPFMPLLPGNDRPGGLFHDMDTLYAWYFCLGAVCGPLHYMWDSTTKDRLRRASLFYINLDIPFCFPLLAKMTFCMLLLLIYILFSIPVLIPQLPVSVILLGSLFALFASLIEYSIILRIGFVCVLMIFVYLFLMKTVNGKRYRCNM